MNIPDSIYEGYVWYSDQSEPKILKGERFSIDIDEKKNPFIVEAMLYDKKNAYSFSIKYVDGKYIRQLNLVRQEDFDNKDVDKKKYLASFGDNLTLVFLRYWKPVADSNCEGMEMLQPEKLVFVGFEDYKED